jgi:hypothetical protein
MNDRIAHVDAVFGGERGRFELMRDELVSLEVLAGAPAFALLARFARGGWSVRELVTVLRFAHPLGFSGSGDAVATVLRERAPMPYVALATKALEGALMGLEPGEASFDEALFGRVELSA